MYGFTHDETEAEETTKPKTQMGPQFMSIYFCARKYFQCIYMLYPLIPTTILWNRWDRLHNLWGPVQNANASPLFGKRGKKLCPCISFSFPSSCPAVPYFFLWLLNVLPQAWRYSWGECRPSQAPMTARQPLLGWRRENEWPSPRPGEARPLVSRGPHCCLSTT